MFFTDESKKTVSLSVMKKFFFLTLSMLLLAAPVVEARKSLKVMSYNIRLGIADDGDNSWMYRRPATIAMLEKEAPDVFGLQEAYKFQQDFITENLPQYKAVGVGRDDGIDKGERMSILYNSEKVELLDWGTYWLSETPDVPSFGWDAKCRRTATWAKLRLIKGGKEFFYVNTHLDHKGREARRRGLAMVLERIGAMNPKGLPMVLTGDFNVKPDDECLIDLNQVMQDARFVAKTSEKGHTFHGWGNTKSVIDYVYFSGFHHCERYHIVSERFVGVPYISDHYPVTAVLVF